MNDVRGETHTALIARGEALYATEPNFSRFLIYTVHATDPEDLADHSVPEIETVLRRSFGFLEKRGAADKFITLSEANPAQGSHDDVIDVFTADMPFIVDSVLAAIRAKGGTVTLFSHPILPYDPQTHRVQDAPTEDTRAESFLHIHLQPLPGAGAREAVIGEISAVLDEVAQAVHAWRPMLERLRQAVQELRENPPKVSPAILAEDMQFLGWLADHNFTFLGMREYALSGDQLEPVAGSGLGILQNPDFHFLRSGTQYVEMTPQHRAFLADPDPLIVTKANVRSRVHRRSHMDYIGIKLYAANGSVRGELRVVGLFTSMSYATPHTAVPLLRRKIAGVLERSGFSAQSHAAKALMSALDSYPREELFQVGEDQLFEFASIIAGLLDRPRLRVLPRIDRFDNFVSVLVYLPRDRYDSEVRARIGEYLAERYDGRVSAYYPHLPEGDLVRVHFIIGRSGGPTPRPPREKLEAELTSLTRSFADQLLGAADEPEKVADWLDAFSQGYQSNNTAADAVADIGVFKRLDGEADIAIRFGVHQGGNGGIRLEVFHRGAPIPLSDRVPILENCGFRVIDEDTFTVKPVDGVEHYLHDMVLAVADGSLLDVATSTKRIEAAILAVWRGEAENDSYNQLTVKANLGWDDVAILRTLGHYLKQLGVSYSQRYLAATLAAHADVARALLELFHTLHDPALTGDRDALAGVARDTIAKVLDLTASIDEDIIIRRFHNLIESSLRTNFYQRQADGSRKPALAIKFDCHTVEGMPEPKPFREIFVYAPLVEGLHLRFGPIARGGLRWSDRPEDFRTEVLGLVKAQQVKNAIIVPVGAKGAFVPKLTPAGADRATVLREGTACYKIFVAALLDLTDNLDGETVVPPPQTVRRDADDPYLVVAADKGTASFSDTANAIALERKYWLGDAFASGGSVGYDHKKMGITARGGWEAVKRHFREIDRDIQRQPFSVVGVGDMSGDVFGNAMLLSPATRLIAAFDHRDIFIDPAPDPAKSLGERTRLFGLQRSSWQDYDRQVLSKGGGIYPRTLKSITLSDEAGAALGLATATHTPQELMRAILQADVDLLWFGGIGTYVRATSESDLQAGDRANDAIRITGAQIRAKIVGEGANLAMTQRGRVEYALQGGRINTDAIDNSAGVNSSDLEVNIKIALGALVRNGTLTYDERNAYLAGMTDEVAALCLRNNYLQTLALSIAQRRSLAEFPDDRALIEALEQRGQLNRAVEFLPDDIALNERALAGKGLTRPELAVLLAYAKNALYADLLASPVPDDPFLGKELFRYVPEKLASDYPDAILGHRLRREVIATVLANAMINRGGPAYVQKMVSATSADPGQVAAAYAAARDTYGLPQLNQRIDALDGRIGGATQLALYSDVQTLLTRETLWFLRNESFEGGLSGLIGRYSAGVATIRALLPTLATSFYARTMTSRAADLEAAGTPADLARAIAELPALSLGTDIVLVSQRASAPVNTAAEAFFGVLELFNLGRIIEAGNAIGLADRFDRMALDRALANLMRAQRDLSVDVLSTAGASTAERLTTWRSARPAAIDRVVKAVADLTEGEVTVSRLSVAAGLLSDLARSA